MLRPQFIVALERCHKENPKAKFFGACNDAKRNMDWCFKVRCLLSTSTQDEGPANL